MNEQEQKKMEENKQKMLACNRRAMERLERILEISEKTLIGVVHPSGYQPGQYGQDYKALGKAICEIREICKHDLSGDFPDYEWMAAMMTSEHFDPKRLEEELAAKASEKPVDYPTFYTPGWFADLANKIEDQSNNPKSNNPKSNNQTIIPGCPSLMPTHLPSGIDGVEPVETSKSEKQAEWFRKHYSFYNGLFQIRHVNTEDGTMASCWINGRRFTLDLDNNESDDGTRDCAAIIKDNGKVIATIETKRGKAISDRMAYAAFKAYVMNLSGSNKYGSRGGFLKQAAKLAAETKELIKKELA